MGNNNQQKQLTEENEQRNFENLVYFRKQEIKNLLMMMMEAQIFSKQLRETWYNYCRSLYLHSMNCHFNKTKKILNEHMPKFWKEHIKVNKLDYYVTKEYFTQEDLEGLDQYYASGKHLAQSAAKNFFSKCLNLIEKFSKKVSNTLNPLFLQIIWKVFQYGIDYLNLITVLKYLPMEKLPWYNLDIGNFGYTIILGLTCMKIREYIFNWISNKIRMRQLGAVDVPLNDPQRVMKIQVKKEIEIIYLNIIKPGKIDRNQTLENLEIQALKRGSDEDVRRLSIKRFSKLGYKHRKQQDQILDVNGKEKKVDFKLMIKEDLDYNDPSKIFEMTEEAD